MRAFLRQYRGILALCGIFFLLGLLRLNDLSLYTDSVRYVIWGTSFARGDGFIDDTQPEPERYVVNAPLYSALLAPALLFFPFSMYAAKVWTLLWGIAALGALFVWARELLDERWALGITAFMAFNPMTLVLYTEALSEAPFLFVFFTGLFILERAGPGGIWKRKELLTLIILLSFTVLLREVSAAFLGAVLVYLIVLKRFRLAGTFFLCAVTVYGLWTIRNTILVDVPATSQSPNLQFIFQQYVSTEGGSLVGELFTRVSLNLRGYGYELGGLLLYLFPVNLIAVPSDAIRWMYRFLMEVKTFLPFLFIPLVAGGMWLDVRSTRTAIVRLMFIPAYLAIILTYPLHDVRFLLPLIPLAVVYAALSIRAILRMRQRTLSAWSRPVGMAAFLIILAPNVLCIGDILRTNLLYLRTPGGLYDRMKEERRSNDYFSHPWSEMGAWISEHTPDDAVVASSAKEIALYIGPRKKLEINNGVPLPMFEALLRDNAVQYIVAPELLDGFRSYEFNMFESRRFRFEPVHRAGGLHLIRVRHLLLEPAQPRPPVTLTLDTSTAVGELWRGRLELMAGAHGKALASFRRAQELDPGNPAIKFQTVVTAALMDDSAGVRTHMDALFLMPRSTSYVLGTRLHLDAMNALRRARTFPSPGHRATALHEVGQMYWALGFPHVAYRITRESIKADPEFFVGLLWRTYFGLQTKDMAGARASLKTLGTIDRENNVVRSLRAVVRNADILHGTTNPAERSRLRLAMARAFESIELVESALDEAERAIAEDERNVAAHEFRGMVFERKQKPLAARQAFKRLLNVQPDHRMALDRVRAIDAN